jgi:GTP pyrophosphokinase
MRQRYPWRVIEARWSDKNKDGKTLYAVNLRIVGHDDIGIVTNVTSVISQESNVILRNINIESHDTLFSGTLTLLIDDYSKLSKLIRKIEGIRGIKQVSRG